MGFDIKELINKINQKLNELIEKAQAYFRSLTQYEKYAWIAFCIGFLMVIIAFITW